MKIEPIPHEIEAMIVKAAELFRLDANLIRAIISTESSFIPDATRFEPHWRYHWNVRHFAEKCGITVAEEEEMQATSWGLMQVMGTVARELGFTDVLSELLLPAFGIFYGCKKLRKLSDKYGDEEKVVSAYNQGSPRMTPGGMFMNQQYVDKVYSRLRELRKLS